MNCSSCGAPLGAVAHIYDDRVYCENCFAKIQQGEPDPAHTVLIGQHSDEDRAAAAQSAPNVNITTETSPVGQAAPAQTTHPSLFLPGEQIIWRRVFSKGIIHRHPTVLELVTNMRILVVDEVLAAIVRAVPISNTTIVVANTRRMSTSVRTGYGRGGPYTSIGSGTIETYGDLEFVNQGKVAFVFHNIRDPYGAKKLVEAAAKSLAKG